MPLALPSDLRPRAFFDCRLSRLLLQPSLQERGPPQSTCIYPSGNPFGSDGRPETIDDNVVLGIHHHHHPLPQEEGLELVQVIGTYTDH